MKKEGFIMSQINYDKLLDDWAEEVYKKAQNIEDK